MTLVVGGFSAATALLQTKVLTIISLYLWGHVGELFTILSLAGFTVAPQVGFVPDEPLVVAAIITGVLWGGKKLYEMGTELKQKLNNESQ